MKKSFKTYRFESSKNRRTDGHHKATEGAAAISVHVGAHLGVALFGLERRVRGGESQHHEERLVRPFDGVSGDDLNEAVRELLARVLGRRRRNSIN